MNEARNARAGAAGVAHPAHDAIVGLGANIGDPAARLSAARQALAALPDTVLMRASSLYRTAPVGYTEQPDFLNAVCWLKTDLAPAALAAALFALEQRLGRVRGALRDGPRVIDLDLLYYEGVESEGPNLRLPHPRLHERAFVLYPWAEILPDFRIPGQGVVRELCAGVEGQRVERLPGAW